MDNFEQQTFKITKKQEHLELVNEVKFKDRDMKVLNLITKLKTLAQIIKYKEGAYRQKLERLKQHLEELNDYTRKFKS